MTKTQHDIIGVMVGIGLLSHVLGYFFWMYLPFQIFYCTFYFNMVSFGAVLMMFAKGWIMKISSMFMFVFGAQFLYMEVWGDPVHWTLNNYLAFMFVGANGLLYSHIIEKIKKKNAATNN